ncbi:hypothetical protein IT087_01830 [Candidatus Uhrbacteria bacterium]|nr:hypothetical protein [Candidatus Uhrbacteria bacterium]
MTAYKKAGLTAEQRKIADAFPGLLDLEPSQVRILFEDEHSLFRGEAKRRRRQERHLDGFFHRRELLGYSPSRLRDNELVHFHDFYVGRLRDPYRKTAPMYGKGSYEQNADRWRASIADVENVYSYLIKLAPEEVRLGHRSVRVRELLRLADDVRTEDPLELLRLTKVSDRMVRHPARCRLILAQICFNARMDGYAPDELQAFEEDLRGFMDRAFFEEPEGDPVHIVAELDPNDHYVCKRHHVVESGQPVPEPRDDVFVMQVFRRRVPRRRKPDAPPVCIYYFLRHKQRMLLKQLDKGIPFPQTLGIGDAVAMMFVVEREDLGKLVSEVQEVVVPDPGQVADLNSSIGHRLGSERLDPRNRRSSKLYEAMKYGARIEDRMVEVQFLPLAAWINSLAARSDVNHAWYKMKRYAASAYPTLFPTSWSGVPWHSPALRRRLIAHSIDHLRTPQILRP